MTTTVEHHDDRPPASGVPRDVPAEVRSRRSMLALAAVESGRLLRHPAVLAATALSVWLLWRWGKGTVPVLHYADIATQFPLAPLAAAALLATNLAVLRPHRDGAVDLYGATRLSLGRRTLAHLLSVLPLAALGGVLVVADLAWLAGVPGGVGTPNLAEAATGPALIVLGGWLGVLLGRVWRSVAVAPLVLVGLAVGSLTMADLHAGGHDQRSWVWLGTLLRPVTIDPPPAALLGRPATWHLVYLLGAAVVLGALAVWRGQAQARAPRRAQAVTGAVVVAALAATTVAAVIQTRPTPAALTARRAAAATNPAAHQVCQRRGPATYCVFPGFEPQIGLWEPTVRAVLAGVPPAAAARALPVTVAQRVGWPRLFEEEGEEGAEASVAGDRPVAPVGTIWGRDGQALAATQARLAGNVAARVIGPPDQVPEPDGEQPKPSSGAALEPAAPTPGCGARAVVALWLAARASPHAAAGLRQQVTDPRFPSFTFVNDVDFDDVWWGAREGQFALALLERPGDQVAQALWRHWDLLTSPATTLERLGELVGIQPPPRRATAPEVGGPLC
ncbi:MAG TPA: hypothetical protein VFL71_16990 [Actinomycetes bacterium]|nr:hypothetical protein [Actinomycetes bacterium]